MSDFVEFTIGEGEYWWCGVSDLSAEMPYTKTSEREFDMLTEPMGNHTNPVFFSSEGRWAWMERLGKYCFGGGKLRLQPVNFRGQFAKGGFLFHFRPRLQQGKLGFLFSVQLVLSFLQFLMKFRIAHLAGNGGIAAFVHRKYFSAFRAFDFGHFFLLWQSIDDRPERF